MHKLIGFLFVLILFPVVHGLSEGQTLTSAQIASINWDIENMRCRFEKKPISEIVADLASPEPFIELAGSCLRLKPDGIRYVVFRDYFVFDRLKLDSFAFRQGTLQKVKLLLERTIVSKISGERIKFKREAIAFGNSPVITALNEIDISDTLLNSNDENNI